MGRQRDPLSVRYDAAARLALYRAIAARKQGRGVIVRISSPGHELRNLDVGGLTHHEREFQRACFYPVFRVPRNRGEVPRWSLRMTWGKREKRGSRWYRPVEVRLFSYKSGARHAATRPQWITNDAARATAAGPGSVSA